MPKGVKTKPRPRVRKMLYHEHMLFKELQKQRVRHDNRIEAIERGDSFLDLDLEMEFMRISDVKRQERIHEKRMIAMASEAGAIFDWLTSIKGLAEQSAAQLIAFIDNVEAFATVSKLWRYAGLAVFDGKAERPEKKKVLHYNSKLKSFIWMIGTLFITSYTPVYRDIYDAEKLRLTSLHPKPEKDPNSPYGVKYTKKHIDTMARRKMMKIFLQHVWVMWRESEGLPVSEPYVQAIMGHTNIIHWRDVPLTRKSKLEKEAEAILAQMMEDEEEEEQISKEEEEPEPELEPVFA